MTVEILILLAIFLVGFFLVCGFISGFVRPSRELQRQLRVLTAAVRAAEAQRANGGHVADLDPIDLAFAAGPEQLKQPWVEFRHTLHGERERPGSPATRWRQTVPAEVFFSDRTVVDGPVGADYYRHLPGILTGLGIIGTFSGLLIGLWGFRPGDSSVSVNNSVQDLLSSVRTAFALSAIAITTAMLITWYEKRALKDLYRQVEQFREAVDRLFDAGAGEDYLASIQRSSSESLSESKRLRTTIADDLIDAIAGINEVQRQMAVKTATSIGEQLTASLTPAVEALTIAVEKSQEDQSAGVQRLLEGTLERFAQRLEEVVGRQLTTAAERISVAANDLREVIVQAPAAIEESVQSIRTILDEIASSTAPIAEHARGLAEAAKQVTSAVDEARQALTRSAASITPLASAFDSTLSAASELSNELQTTVGAVDEAAERLAGANTALSESTETLETTTSLLSNALDQARDDQATHRELGDAVKQAANELSRAQTDLDGFLDGLASTLAGANETFGRELSATLDSTHGAFHSHLSDATQQVAGAVADLRRFVEDDFQDAVESLQSEMSRLSPATEA